MLDKIEFSDFEETLQEDIAMPSVLHIVSSMQLGGAERFTLDLVRLQRQQGLDSKILSLGTNDDFLLNAAMEEELPVFVSNAKLGRIARYRELLRIFEACDVVHFHNAFGLRFLAPLILLFPKKKYIYTRHGIYKLDTVLWKILHQWMRLFVNYVTFVTSTGREVFEVAHRWNPKTLKVIENGVYIPDDFEKEFKLPLRFGSVGRMVELKGQLRLLETVVKVSKQVNAENMNSPFELHFFGSGPMEEKLKKLACKVDKNVNVVFHGLELNQDRIYRNIDVLIVNSHSEGMSLVIMEAMARGIPVIATNVGGNTTLINDGETGIITRYGNDSDLEFAILNLANDLERVRLLGNKSRERIIERFSLTKTHESYLELYGI